MVKTKKPKKPKKFFDTPKKKVAVIILVLGLVITGIGFGYPSSYWHSKNAYSSQELKDDQTNTGDLILYDTWDSGYELSLHVSVRSVKEMRGTIYIEGVTYTDKLDFSKNLVSLNDNHLVDVGNGQYFVVVGLEDPPLHDGDSVLVTGMIRTMLGEDSAGNPVTMEILFVDPIDIEQTNMDNVFLSIGIMGIVILFIGVGIWMFFVFVPEEKDPDYIDIHSKRKKEFVEQVGKKDPGKSYACPACGIDMAYKEEFGKWYCDICNKMY